MALNTAALKAGILQLLTDMESRNADAKAEFADRLANLMKDFVMTGKVQAGIAVTTTGTAAAQSGATTMEGTIL